MQATALKDEAAVCAERDRRDIKIIKANADYLNAGAEENLEFQADIEEAMRLDCLLARMR